MACSERTLRTIANYCWTNGTANKGHRYVCALFHNSIVAVSLDKSRPTTNFHQLPDGKIIQYHPPLRIFIFCLLCYISVFLPPSPSQDFRVKKGGKRIRPNPEPVDFTGVSRFVLIISYGHTFATLIPLFLLLIVIKCALWDE